jgi:hypothetical protein
MPMFVEPYNPEKEIIWDQFVKNCKNSHFFFYRKYLEYHSNRFKDSSLIVYDDNNKIITILPANKSNDQLISHGGLTFGGFLMDDKMTTSKLLLVMDQVITYCKSNNIQEFIYKPIPHIYSKKTSQEDLYALFRNNAELFRRDVCSVIDFRYPFKYSNRRTRNLKKANLNIDINEDAKLDIFWNLLEEVLNTRHGVSPVHSLQEIKQLQSNFPNNISLITGSLNGKLVSGIVIFETDNVAHLQYIATNNEGRDNYVLDRVIDYSINKYKEEKLYFSFGISNENNGKVLNDGLIAHKEGFGAKAIVHDFFKIKIQ